MARRPGAYAGVNGAIAPMNWPWIGLLFSRRSRSLHSDDSAQPSRRATDITMMAIPLQIKPRWRLRSAHAKPSRVEICPPGPGQTPGSTWQRLLHWMMSPAPQDVAAPRGRMPALRAEFVAALADIGTDEAVELCLRVQQAQCLRELWHARSDVFRTVGVALGEAEAELRLAQLDRHFQTRSPRSKWAPL